MTEFSDDEALAAEYALGTLDATEREAAERRRRGEPAFAALVSAWEERLAPLSASIPDLAPPPALLAGILARLPVRIAALSDDTVVILRRRLRVWRGVAAVASALAAVLAVWVVAREPSRATDAQTYVAVLQHGTDIPSFLVSVDLTHRRMAVMPLAMSAPPDKSFELWMIAPDQPAPRSMGVLDAHATVRAALPDVNRDAMPQATYAVTLEPLGGSPTGKPTSTPMFVGKLMQTAL